MSEGFFNQRLLRITLISGVLFAAFLLLEPYGYGWTVIPGGLAVAGIILLVAMWHSRRTHKQLEEIRQELEDMRDRDEDA